MAYLSKGCKGENVRKLQTALNRAGCNIPVDGDYGEQTRKAVVTIQGKHGLKQDGIAGPSTMKVLEPYMQDFALIADAVDDCIKAVEALPEFKRLEQLLYG